MQKQSESYCEIEMYSCATCKSSFTSKRNFERHCLSERHCSVLAAKQQEQASFEAHQQAISSSQLVSPLPSKLGPHATEEEIQSFICKVTKHYCSVSERHMSAFAQLEPNATKEKSNCFVT